MTGNIDEKNAFTDNKLDNKKKSEEILDKPIDTPKLPVDKQVQTAFFEDSSKLKTSNKGKSQQLGKKNWKNKKDNVAETEIIAPSDKNTVPNGYKLEYRMKRLLFFMGYYTRIGIDILTHSDESADKITDLDVYGIYIHKDFTSKTTWVDCKSGGVEIHKRISWIKGIMVDFEINDMIFVAGGARTSVKQYARKSGIQILDLSIIEKLEKDFGVVSENWKGSWNPQTQFNKINNLSKLNLPNEQVNKKIAKFISSDYWILDNYTKSKRTITALRELSTTLENPLSNDQTDIVKWGIYELVTLFLLSIFNISKEIYYFSDSEKKETIQEGLTSSDISNKRRSEMFETAFKVAYGMVKNQYPDIILPQKMPSFNMTPPSYFESYYDLVLRVTSNPLYYYDLLRFLDYVLMEYDLQSKDIEIEDLTSIFNNYSEILIGAKTFLNFICHITNIPRSYFKLLTLQIPGS